MDWLGIVEAAYRLELPEKGWMEGLLSAVNPELNEGPGIWGAIYDAKDPSNVQYRAVSVIGGIDPEAIMAAQRVAKPADIERTLRSATCGTTSQLLGASFAEFATIHQFGPAFGVYDALGVNARDSSGKGAMLVGLLPRVTRLSATRIAHWERIAAHVATAFRLRSHLSDRGQKPQAREGVDAVVAPGGTIEHAEGPAVLTSARRQLGQAAIAIERARGPLRDTDAERAVKEWKGLVAARWSLVDFFDSDGKRFLVARQNEPAAPGPEALSPRERQVVAFAALGHSNKLIAYELGIAHSTVKVLLSRAAAKLGVATRTELIRRFMGES